MNYIDYGYIKASRLGIGTSTYGSKIGMTLSFKILEELYEQGVNYIDTASSYGLGDAENIIGRFCQNKRENFFLSTKVGIRAKGISRSKKILLPIVRKIYNIPYFKKKIIQNSASVYQDNIMSVEAIYGSIADSFENMKTDYIDQLLFHNHFSDYLENTEILDMLYNYKEKGVIKRIGISLHSLDDNILINLNKYKGIIDTLQIPFALYSYPINFQGKINYFSVFSQKEKNVVADQVKEQCEFYSNGHFIVSMSSKNHIKTNIALLG